MKSNSESYLSSPVLSLWNAHHIDYTHHLYLAPCHHIIVLHACGVLFLKTCEQTLHIVCSIHSTCHLALVLANCNNKKKYKKKKKKKTAKALQTNVYLHKF